MKILRFVLLPLAPLLLVACATGAGAAPRASAAWPAEFERHFCTAMAEAQPMSLDLMAMSNTAENLPQAAVHAGAAADRARRMVASLETAPDWRPARDIMAAYVRAMRSMLESLDEIRRGAAGANDELLSRGLDHMDEATEQVNRATDMVDGFQTTTGFACP
jgi:hypothetical protein